MRLNIHPDGGSITIRAHATLDSLVPAYNNELVLKSGYKAHRYVYISVTDTGTGISKESIKYLFERYYRITQQHLGSGIGLAFVKSLVFLHKGEIYVYSERGKGTGMLSGLPAEKDDYGKEERWMHTEQRHVQLESLRYQHISETEPLPAVASPPAIPEDAPTREHKKHILVVDDNEELRSFLKDSLESLYHVGEAPNGKEGLQLAKEKIS